MKDTKTIDAIYSANTYSRAPVVFDHGEGARLYDDQGKCYIDFGSGIGVMSLGYNNRGWTKAVTEQATKLAHTSNLFYNEKTALLAGRLCLRTRFERVFFSNSGAEANECLIKTARKWAEDTKGPGEHPFVTLKNSFHGRTVTTVTATGQDTFHKFFGPFTPGFRYVPANDIEALRETLDKEDCSGFLVEIVQGEGGAKALDAEYLREAEALCREKNVLFCVDEVQTGNGRTGTWFAYEHFGLSPDIVSTAKGLGNGLPIGATLMSARVSETLVPGSHGSTFGGNPIACAGALAVLEQIDDAFLADVTAKGERIRAELAAMPNVYDVSGLGMMIGFSVKGKTAAEVKAKALDVGLVVLTAKDRVRLLPPLGITESELTGGLGKLARVLA